MYLHTAHIIDSSWQYTILLLGEVERQLVKAPDLAEFPGCAIVLCGDINRPEVKRLSKQFRKCQLVNKPAWGNLILNLV